MASMFESVEKMPVWQRLATWVVVAAALVAVWYFLFFVDAVAAREGAQQGMITATAELSRVEKRKENYLEELRKHEERKAKSRENLEVVPMSASTVDNVMAVFQQKARQVGMSVDNWTNEPEQRQDVYARLPVKVKARGSWAQVGEFFRQLSEFRRPLSIENLRLAVETVDSEEEHPPLTVEFEAAAYRALSEDERSTPKGGRTKPSRRRKGK